MARRIDIELTGARPDGTWSWRAAGALNPRGALDATLLYNGAKSGDVVRAEADFSLDGITIVSVEPPRAPEASDPNRIELLDRPAGASVTTQLIATRGRAGERPGRPEHRRGDRDGDGRRNGQPGRSFDRPGPRGPAGADRGPATAGGESSERRGRAGRPPRAERPAADGPGAGPANAERPPRPERSGRPSRPTVGPGRGGPGRDFGRAEQAQPGAQRGRRDAPGDEARGARRSGGANRPHRLVPGNTHRNAMLESLPVEQQAIAQQLLRGGIPAVRTALHFEREKAREEGRPEPSTEGVVALAESLVSRVKAAEWRDRADAALAAGDDLAMRDLRALVSGSDVARDEASRELVVSLREMLERRVEAHRSSWADEVTRYLDEGHVIRALRLSSRPPDAGARFSAELAGRLRDAASAALAPAAGAEQWLALLQAAAESPVRRAIKPAGLPTDPSPEVLDVARHQAGRVPGLAPLLGLSVPPPPGPARPVPARPPHRRPVRAPRPPRPARPVASAPAPARPAAAADVEPPAPGPTMDGPPEDLPSGVPVGAGTGQAGVVAELEPGPGAGGDVAEAEVATAHEAEVVATAQDADAAEPGEATTSGALQVREP